jgi:small acid-soluble spore protein H (minor)
MIKHKLCLLTRRRKSGMNVGRAKEIVESADMINVTYDGSPIIIQHVDEKTKMARIYSKSEPDVERDVPILNLIEE